MSLDKSLKLKAGLSRHRNVLTRAERVAMLQAQERWNPEVGALGLPKVGNRKVTAGGKKKKEEAAEGAAPAAGAAAPAAADKAKKK